MALTHGMQLFEMHCLQVVMLQLRAVHHPTAACPKLQSLFSCQVPSDGALCCQLQKQPGDLYGRKEKPRNPGVREEEEKLDVVV